MSTLREGVERGRGSDNHGDKGFALASFTGKRRQHGRRQRFSAKAFTLIELLVALSILAVAAAVSAMAFSNITRAWQRGTALAEDLNHADFVMDQLTMGLRSAYWVQNSQMYGFLLTSDGGGSQPQNTISWVKTGSALVGKDSPLVAMPHRVEISVGNDKEARPALLMKAWCPYLQPEDFDKEKLDSIKLSTDVVGLSCKVSTNLTENPLNWSDEWESTNDLPPAIELTLYLKPLDERSPPVEVKRFVRMPMVPDPPPKKR
jgi:prepilin-type N-terminal cleavage/methylation domain-containing protein